MVDSTPELNQSDTSTAQVSDPVLGDIAIEWDWVKEGIKEILEVDKGLTFSPDHVYAACLAQQAILWVAEGGFVISTGETDIFNGERTFLVWLAWAEKRGDNLAVKHLPFFEAAAKGAGFSKIEVRSAVPEVVSYLENTGWEVDTVVFKRYL